MEELQLNDLYWTFQGEGFHTGKRALFVRFPFCSLNCSWCDTSFNSYKKFSEERFKDFAKKEASRFAVLTGGEPSLHKHTKKVIRILKDLRFTEISMESNACHEIPEGVSFLTLSPKRDSSVLAHSLGESFYIHPEAYKKASEFKYVVDRDFDFEILSRHNLKDGRKYYLSPEYSEMKKNLKKIMDFIKENPLWKISLQTHKWIGID